MASMLLPAVAIVELISNEWALTVTLQSPEVNLTFYTCNQHIDIS